jgi:hypothetical protein
MRHGDGDDSGRAALFWVASKNETLVEKDYRDIGPRPAQDWSGFVGLRVAIGLFWQTLRLGGGVPL